MDVRSSAASPTNRQTRGSYALRYMYGEVSWQPRSPSPTYSPVAHHYHARNESDDLPMDLPAHLPARHSAHLSAHEEYFEQQELENADLQHSTQMDDPEDGFTGLIQNRLSDRHRHALQRSQSGGRSLKESLASNHLVRTISKRSGTKAKRESLVLSALPPLPDNMRYTGGASPPWAGGLDVEKQSPTLFSPSQPTTPMRRSAMPPQAGGFESDVVQWNGPDDPENPMNWPRNKKWACTFALGFVTFCVTFASSVLSPGTESAAMEFGVDEEVMLLATALFVLGFAFGPIVWGPASELYGRKVPLFVGFAIFAIFQIPVAVASNLETVLVSRFLAGFAGCSPLTIVGGALADFWVPVDRGIAVSIFSCATFLGPTLGPLIGGLLIDTPGYGWRWTAWVTFFCAVVFGSIGWAVYPETFAPVLLQQRAKKLRYSTKNWAIHAPADEIEINMKSILEKYLSKPILMLIFEPILLLVTIYISLIYGILCEYRLVSLPICLLTFHRPILRLVSDLLQSYTRLEPHVLGPTVPGCDAGRGHRRHDQLRFCQGALHPDLARKG